jgi:hypothetical protein
MIPGLPTLRCQGAEHVIDVGDRRYEDLNFLYVQVDAFTTKRGWDEMVFVRVSLSSQVPQDGNLIHQQTMRES